MNATTLTFFLKTVIILRKLPENTNKHTEKIINNQLDIKLRQFKEEELDTMQKELKAEKTIDLDEISPEIWKTSYETLCIDKTQMRNGQERWPRNH